jgi:hypothetical protein
LSQIDTPVGIQSLTPPQDITWTRVAYSRDMVDTNFGDLKFPPKWRSSLAVYNYIVPEEETADAYPNSRIVYLRLTCSITGWNPNEELQNAMKTEGIGDASDDVQKSVWETIMSDGWANAYEPCLGAIMQIAIYPSRSDDVEVDDYPEIMDFEPKKRELYEAVTEGSERLSGTSSKLSILKGDTSTSSSEMGMNFGISGGGFSLGGQSSAKESTTTVNENTTDTSREARETLSHSTSFSQMYQLFNGYHIGTNRAVFVVAPRPHTLSKTENNEDRAAEFNLINGQRALEGIQDVFLVVNLPRKLTGFCIQASIDTGHTIMANSIMAMDNKTQPNGEEAEDCPQGQRWDAKQERCVYISVPESEPTGDVYNDLVVTRRIIQNCGKFDDNGNFVITGVPDLGPPRGVIVWEDSIPTVSTNSAIFSGKLPLTRTNTSKAELVNQMNIHQRRIIKSMISGFSAGNFEPVEFMKSKTFKRLTRESIQNLNIPLSKLVELGYLTEREADFLTKSRIPTIGDIFKGDLGQSQNPEIRKMRIKILRKTHLRSKGNKLMSNML